MALPDTGAEPFEPDPDHTGEGTGRADFSPASPFVGHKEGSMCVRIP